MRLLLDTHVLIWWAQKSDALPPAITAAIDHADNTIYISAVSAAEMAVKAAIGKLDVAPGLIGTSPDDTFIELPFVAAHAAVLRHLPLLHRDPFDRMLVAQALAEGLILVTLDEQVRRYDVPVFPPRGTST